MLLEKFENHSILNPRLWTEDNKLKSDVSEKIKEIAKVFNDYCELDLPILDIYLVGSNASYNYTDTSDLDMHIITNFDLMDASDEVLQTLYNLQKSSFNTTYDISIHKVPIEVYVEDVSHTTAVSNGIYSVFKDRWIKFPKKISVTEYDFSEILPRWRKAVQFELDRGNLESVTDMINKLYIVRKNSIDIDGEYGKGNQLFKELRSEGLLDSLKEKRNELLSKEMSIEDIDELGE